MWVITAGESAHCCNISWRASRQTSASKARVHTASDVITSNINGSHPAHLFLLHWKNHPREIAPHRGPRCAWNLGLYIIAGSIPTTVRSNGANEAYTKVFRVKRENRITLKLRWGQDDVMGNSRGTSQRRCELRRYKTEQMQSDSNLRKRWKLILSSKMIQFHD